VFKGFRHGLHVLLSDVASVNPNTRNRVVLPGEEGSNSGAPHLAVVKTCKRSVCSSILMTNSIRSFRKTGGLKKVAWARRT